MIAKSKSKTTENLLGEIKNTKNTEDLGKYLGENNGDMLVSLKYRLSNLLSQKDKSRKDVKERGGLTDYNDQIFNGWRNPNRDKLIRVILGLEANIDEAQELLRLAVLKELDPRDPRDAVIISCINSRMNGIDTDLRLDKLGFKPLK